MTAHYHPHSPYSQCCLAALRQYGSNARMSRKRNPVIADAGEALMRACGTGNWFLAATAAQTLADLTRADGLGLITQDIERVIAAGNDRIVRPYLAELERAKVAA